MSGGFWAGAVPPWAFVALVVLVILVIGGIALGSWYGYGRGFAHAEEEARWSREQAKARRTRPAYRHHELSECPDEDYCPVHGRAQIPPEWAHEDQALTIANDWPSTFGALDTAHEYADETPITTGEIQAITDETDAMVARWKADNDLWMAEHGLSGGEA